MNRGNVEELINIIPFLSPYNFEAIDLVLKQFKIWMEEEKGLMSDEILFDDERIIWVKDRITLLTFLKFFKMFYICIF